MRPATFDYLRPSSVAEAIEMLAANEGAKALAGGHSLIPAMNLRLSTPEAIVDIGRLPELKGISVNGTTLMIGALSTHAEIAASADVRMHAPALASACGQVGDPQVRSWGTLGGNLAHADPASDPPTVILADNAVLHLQGPQGQRTVSADDFFVDLFTTSLQAGEIITGVQIPSLARYKSAYAKLSHPASRYAVVGVCVVMDMDGNMCRTARVAVGGATPKATRARQREAVFQGAALDDTVLNNAAQAIMEDVGSGGMSDVYASADYRRAMAGVFLKRAIRAAMG